MTIKQLYELAKQNNAENYIIPASNFVSFKKAYQEVWIDEYGEIGKIDMRYGSPKFLEISNIIKKQTK